jgi:hypothetical protein
LRGDVAGVPGNELNAGDVCKDDGLVVYGGLNDAGENPDVEGVDSCGLEAPGTIEKPWLGDDLGSVGPDTLGGKLYGAGDAPLLAELA